MVLPGEGSISLTDLVDQLSKQGTGNSCILKIVLEIDTRKEQFLFFLEVPSEPPSKRLKTSSYPFERVVFIDSTWHTVTKIASDERLQRELMHDESSNFVKTVSIYLRIFQI